ncbi:UDP-N-acetylglucosamine--N-acetylmuramyl-(pentapeptide) pyrophosphoryl-undecaprenol N-acetylglucosamine transferase [Staphylothermus hellenicus]|uniref:Oligosaccharide biosynthesis protein Alg14 like protein n=1 Tax=Staphylothermus hellenicus (strain DSM 12710 / JCM 10830 / BK20S6-10-b1 / P8) TaxID=591019 RepID=D7DA77_STAHD|nr:polysaccharide biosynthesis protein [Staphylothermus hellenicus]ADI32673.1 Oligosaccharide biosynthesis protein Alg14 like protein [Staphylothermus hellenicus DSM 12710]
MAQHKNILLIASGGGHTGYIVGIAEKLCEKSSGLTIDIIIPCGDSWSQALLEKYADRILCVPKPRLPGESFVQLLRNIPSALYYSLRRIRRYDIVVASGSNHSLAPALISMLKGSKLYVVESHDRFVTKGKTVALLSSIGGEAVLHWNEQKKLYPRGHVFGPIVRQKKYEISDKGYILAIGGFEGNKKLYDTLVDTELENVVLQTGHVNPEIYKSKRPNWIVFRFDPDIDKWIAGAKVVIGHNSVTILEAAVTYRKPVVLIWNPMWKAAATKKDVEIFTRKINGVFLDGLSRDKLLDAIEKAVRNKPPKYINGADKFAEYLIENTM